MNKLLLLIAILAVICLITACKQNTNVTEAFVTDNTTIANITSTAKVTQSTTTTEVAPDIIVLVSGGKSDYIVYRSEYASDDEKSAAKDFRNEIKSKTSYDFMLTTDFEKPGTDMTQFDGLCEILIGNTNRNETKKVLETLGDLQYAVSVVDRKLVIVGVNGKGTVQAVEWFINNYMTEKDSITVPIDLNYIGSIDYGYCEGTQMRYSEMANEVYTSFIKNCFRKGCFRTSSTVADFWDNAEMLETLIDGYENTKNESILADITTAADWIVVNRGKDWQKNVYNDDIMWMCIAFSRLYLLTGNEDYLFYAKSNFDTVYERAINTKLGGGLWWKQDQQNTKNACVNCPAAIAACYIAKGLANDESDAYYQKAKELMDWVIEKLYDQSGGVNDSIRTDWSVSTYRSTYNQGTFIGACTLLHEKYSNEDYLKYANKAADYTITRMTDKNGILDNGEAPLDNGDLIGFKGIFTRWLYRYAKYTNNLDYLEFLQNNAEVAYSNRNEKGLIWTGWKDKTEDEIRKYDVYGLSTAVALMFNSIPWNE